VSSSVLLRNQVLNAEYNYKLLLGNREGLNPLPECIDKLKRILKHMEPLQNFTIPCMLLMSY
jgi:hypothetical protein